MLGETIKQLRLEKGLSQAELAGQLSVVRQTVSKWEKELSVPDSEMLVTIAEVLGVSTSELLGEGLQTTVTVYKPPQRLKVWEIVLLALGSPIWLSLGIATAAVVVSLYAVWWSLIVSLWAVFAAFAGCALVGAAAGIWLLIGGDALAGIALFGVGFVCAGLSILLFGGSLAATKNAALLTAKSIAAIRKRLSKREGVS
ncbi:MAG: helix-turn-helix transcriptional regulator [Clostridia bacterium]|nr:helix-turn-helix transcriptional regulator [Clostridia bacterium]